MSSVKLHEQMNDSDGGKSQRYLSFSLGEEEYAIPLLVVREVIAPPEITPIPFTPPHFLGIMNLRGQVISVIDFRVKLGIKPGSGQETAVIICQLSSICLGIIVDSINQVISPSPGEISDKPEIQSSRSSDYITHVFRKPDALVLLIDISKALGVEDLNLASKAA